VCEREREREWGELGTGGVDFGCFLEGVGGSWGVSCARAFTLHIGLCLAAKLWKRLEETRVTLGPVW
jgi:hypothetical protein